MNNEVQLGIGLVLYILYIIGINPHCISMYKSISHKSKGAIKRGNEWD